MKIAERDKVYTVGHIPFKLGIKGIIKGGLNEIAHIEEIVWFLAEIDTSLNLAPDQWYAHLFTAFYETYPGILGSTLEKDRDKAKLKERIVQIVKDIKVSKIAVCSTLSCDENLMLKLTDLDKILKRHSAKYLPMSFVGNLEKGVDRHQQMFKGVEETTHNIYEMCELMIKELKQQKVPVVLGTDAGVISIASVPGFSLHRELQLMTANGYSPYEALVTCTVNAAKIIRAMGQESNFGTIEKGKRADLILVKKNPLEDIKNTKEILGVMVSGKWFPKEKIQKILAIKRIPISKVLQEICSRKGVDAAIKAYYQLKKEDYLNRYFITEQELNQVGYNLLGGGKIAQAIKIFKLNVSEFPTSANVYDSMGEAYMKNGDRDNAINNYLKSLKLNPSNKNAKEMLKKLKIKKNAEFYYNECETNSKKGNVEKAIECDKKAVQLKKDKANYYYQLFLAYDEKLKKLSGIKALICARKCRKALEKAVGLDGKNIEMRRALFRYYLNAPKIAGGSKEKARQQASEILKLDLIRGCLIFVDYYLKENDLVNAEKCILEAFKLHFEIMKKQPQKDSKFNSRVLNLYGYRLIQMKNIDKAIKFFKMNIEAYPDFYNCYDSLAEAYMINGDKELAVNTYEKALKLNPRKTKLEKSIYDNGVKNLEKIKREQNNPTEKI